MRKLYLRQHKGETMHKLSSRYRYPNNEVAEENGGSEVNYSNEILEFSRKIFNRGKKKQSRGRALPN